ncbi:heat shock 70 kDa protein-like [Senna tora]|uniref:Heat shock 70 kDa protein-like n=1 Tax=Senna tora TaxID=362788 RepID=A0A834TXE5_9FABA|nr:heat shock 70 kDa protein-like [Senna tora]
MEDESAEASPRESHIAIGDGFVKVKRMGYTFIFGIHVPFWIYKKRNDPDGSSCGGVIRDSGGTWVAGFSKKLGRSNAFQAEVWGCVLGLRIAWELNLPKVILELDSTMAYQFVSGKWEKNHPLYGLASEIEDFFSKDWEVKLSLVYREGNRLADGLAKLGHTLDFDLHRFKDPPPSCVNIYVETIIRFPRFSLGPP